ncbi:MAG: glycosyltransferase family 2 protein [Candidatus Gottesmanbacteria bacterium]
MVNLSIIIPSYNTKQLLVDCINSIYKETKTTFEVIVIDNGSTDGTVEEIKKLSNSEIKGLKLIENHENLGFAKSVNQGIKEALGRYILLLNSDTLIIDNAIDNEIRFLETHQDVSLVGCQLRNPDNSIQPSGGYLPNLLNIFIWMTLIDDLPVLNSIIKSYHITNHEFYLHQQYLGWVTGAFFLTKREIFDKIGFFDEHMFMYVEEIDWCYRLDQAGLRIAFDPSSSIIHHKGGSINNQKAGIIEEFQGLKYYFNKNKPGWQMPILRVCLKIGALVRIILFGIIVKDQDLKNTYAKAFRVA